MNRFDDCLSFTTGRNVEGGTSNNVADTGGLTQNGITQATYDDWRTKQGLPVQPVTGMAWSEEYAIYQSEYWAPNHCDQLPVPVDLCVFDCDVNSGDGRAAKLLQQCAGVTQDSDIGPGTLAAVGAMDAMSLAAAFCNAREAYVRAIAANNPTQTIFLEGWLNRINLVRQQCGLPVQP